MEGAMISAGARFLWIGLLLIELIVSSAWADDERAPRIISFGDVHGGAEELGSLLSALELVDAEQNWIGGDTHLVSLGDLLDRGPDSRQVMDLLMKLESQAPLAGGQVSVVLGNHEIMNLTGDMRYVADEEFAAFEPDEDPDSRAAARNAYITAAQAADIEEPIDQEAVGRRFDKTHPPGFFGHRQAFQSDGHYGRWLLSKPQVLVLGRTAFVHGGLSEHFTAESIDDFNQRAARELADLLALGTNLTTEGSLMPWQDFLTAESRDLETPLPEALFALRRSIGFADDGPSWYRGTANCHALIEAPRFERVLAAQGLDRVIMGHTPTNPRIIQSRFGGRAILSDTGMLASYYSGRPSAVILDGDELEALNLAEDGVLTPRLGSTPVDIRAGNEERLHGALDQAVQGMPVPDTADPVPMELTGRTYHALFHRGSKREHGNRMAAHAIDKYLGLGLVAPTVRVGSGKRTRTVQAYPANAINETQRFSSGLSRPNWCGQSSDYQLLYALDALIGTDVRTGTSILYDKSTWLMYLIGHESTFPTSDGLPRYLDEIPAALPVALKNKLARLDRKALEPLLGEYLGDRQIKAILKRRDRMLGTWPVEE